MATFYHSLNTCDFSTDGVPVATTFLLDSTSDGFAAGFRAPWTGTITRLGCRISAVAGSGVTYTIGLQGASGNAPDGTWKTNSTTTCGISDGTGFKIYNVTGYSCTAGEELFMVVQHDSGAGSTGTPDGSNNITLDYGVTKIAFGFPNAYTTNGSWSAASAFPVFVVGTASQLYGMPFESTTLQSASTTGHRLALKFRMPTGSCDTYKIRGVQFYSRVGNSSSSAATSVGLWNSSGDIVERAVQTNLQRDYTGYYPKDFYFAESSALTAGTYYYIGVESQDGTAIAMDTIDVADSSHLDAFSGGTGWHLATYNASTWSDVNTSIPLANIRFSDLTGAAGTTEVTRRFRKVTRVR